MGMRHWVRSKLHRRIFVWFGASIIATGATVWIALALVSPPSTWHDEVARIRRYVGHQYSRVWDDPIAREEVGRAMSEDLEIGIVLRHPGREGAVIAQYGPECEDPRHGFEAPVESSRGELLGTVEMCAQRERTGPGWMLLLGLGVACGTLWAFSGVIARRLARPIQHVVQVAQDIGHGKLGSRVKLGRHARHRIGEIGVLADAIDEMATRIEKQLRDQKELLAAVSHEIRTPLGHIRILLESARDAAEQDGSSTTKTIDELEREVLEIDGLVGELLGELAADVRRGRGEVARGARPRSARARARGALDRSAGERRGEHPAPRRRDAARARAGEPAREREAARAAASRGW